MEKRGQSSGKGQPMPSSSKSEGTMTTRYRRKKEEEKSSRKEEQSKRLRLHLDQHDGLNNDLVLTVGTMRVPFEEAEQKVKIEDCPISPEVETGSAEDTGHLPGPQVVVKIESPGTFPAANEIIVKEEVDIPMNDDEKEEEFVEDSNLLPEDPVRDNNDDVFVVEADVGAVQKENSELRKLLHERDLEIKRLQEEMEGLKISSYAGSSSISGQCSTEAQKESPAARIETLEIENQELRTLLARKDAENGALAEKISQLERDIPRATGTSKDITFETEKMDNARAMRVIENCSRIAAEKATARPLSKAEETLFQLFPDVLKIIIYNEPTKTNSVHWRSLMPLLTACRLVCKSWKESIDYIIQQVSFHFDLGTNYRNLLDHKKDFTPCPLIISYPEFDHARWTDEIERIRYQVLMNRSYNPIPSRHLMLVGRAPENLNSKYCEKWTNYCQIVKSFLEKAGEQVWYLTVDFYADLVALCKCLSEWFSLLPKLRSLSLGPNIYTYPSHEDVSFPKFEHLEVLTFGGNQPTTLYDAILMNNRHVNKLAFPPLSGPSPVSIELDLPNLSTLKCTFLTSEDWEKFAHSATWKLEDLRVQFCPYFFGKTRPTTAQFSEGVAKFGRTLKSLTFDLSQIGVDDGRDLELNLPQLKSLHLTCKYSEALPLGRLLASLKNLESVSLEFLHLWRSHITQKGFLDYLNNFCGKADWMKLPKLRNVKISLNFGERDLIVMKRENMPSVIFSIPDIKKLKV